MKDQKGFSLIEVVVLAVALLGIIGVGFSLATASTVLFIADERATAESLARNQMEYVKSEDYRASDYTPGPPPQGSDKSYRKIVDSELATEGYTIWSVNRSGATVEDIIGVPWDSQTDTPANADAGIQKIRLVVKHHGKEIFTFIRDSKKITLEAYKVNR